MTQPTHDVSGKTGMTFVEELLLLLLDENTGYFAPVPEWKMSCAFAGGVLMDLALKNRIDSDLDTLTVISGEPTGDDILDPVLEEISREEQTHNPQFWVERIAARAESISDKGFTRLVEMGILDFDAAGFWALSKKVSRTGRYPLVDGAPGEEIKQRITRILLTDEIPGPRDIAIIGLLNNCDGVRTLLDAEELETAVERVELLSGMDLIGRTISEAVRTTYQPPEALRTRRRKKLPSIGLIDVLRSRAMRQGNLPKFFAEQAKKHGPVFQINAGRNRLIVLASKELNLWTGKKGRLLLRTRDYLEGFQQEWGTARSIASMDGADHFRMRKAMRDGVSRTVVEDRIPDLCSLARKTFGDQKVNGVIPVEAFCQRLIGAQIAELTLSFVPSDKILDDLLKFEYRALFVHLYGLMPSFMLRTPRMKKYKRSVLDLYAQIHATHTPAQRAGKRRDLADDLLELHQSDPQFLPETDLGFTFIAALIAGHYAGSAMAFAVYELLANPELHERIAAEADALFENGDPDPKDLNPEAIDVTHRFAMEVQRLHPVINVHRRTAMNSFEIDGAPIPAYSNILIAFTATHFSEKYFREPEKFDIERYLPPRNEHTQTGAYVPFGTGTHTCSGRRWTELQLVLNILLIARYLDLEMAPKNYRLKLSPFPKLSPSRNFKVRIKGYRRPLASAEA